MQVYTLRNENCNLPIKERRKKMNGKEFCGMIYESEKMETIRRVIEGLSSDNSTILLTGETGTGKELAAKAIHATSSRSGEKLVVADCSCISATLFESEFFGHKKGAFTNATVDREGLFEYAHRGTIFLDEISSICPGCQVMLLRVLEEGKVKRVGENIYRSVDVRIIAASNEDLETLVDKKKFRSDLFYRLNVMRIHLPPLRERKEDIPVLAYSFWKKFSQQMDIPLERAHPVLPIAVSKTDWPGNVRELKNFIESRLRLAKIGVDHASLNGNGNGKHIYQEETLPEAVIALQKRMILEALKLNGGNLRNSASTLGITKRQLEYSIQKLGITKTY